MRLTHISFALILATALAWWLLRDNPLDQVLAAHEDLIAFLNKPEGAGDTVTVLEIRRLQGLFAAHSTLSWRAPSATSVSDTISDTLVSESGEELAALLLRVRASFHEMRLSSGTIDVGFPDEDTAQAHLQVEFDGIRTDGGVVTEAAAVESTMQRQDGEWLFTGFVLNVSD